MPVIKLSPDRWTDILVKIELEHGKAAVLIRDVMRRELGFTSRHHKFWQPSDGLNGYDGHGDYVTEVHLDFYDDAKETMFRLKYL